MNAELVKATALLAEALMLKPTEINNKTALGQTPQWDSLAHMRLILAVEEELGHLLSPQDIVSIGSFDDVCTLLR